MTPILDILPPAKRHGGDWYCVWGHRDKFEEFGDHLLATFTTAHFSWREINRLTPANHDEMIAAAELAVNLTVRAQHRCFEEEIRA